jgi:hypothetical protein
MNNVSTQAQAEIHAAYRRDLDEDQMNELARHAGRRLDWVEKVWREMSEAEKVAFANYRIAQGK